MVCFRIIKKDISTTLHQNTYLSTQITMRFHHQFVTLILVLAVFGDVGNFINSVWTGQELISTNSALILPGAEAVWGHVAKAVVRGVEKSIKRKGRRMAEVNIPKTKDQVQKGSTRKGRVESKMIKTEQVGRNKKEEKMEAKKGGTNKLHSNVSLM